jgi:hypothetical protein
MDTKTPPASAGFVTPEEQVSALARSLDCIAEHDLCLLAKITPLTAESWRKRGKGPAYVLIGNRYLYPRQAVAEFVQSNVRERRTVPAKAVL